MGVVHRQARLSCARLVEQTILLRDLNDSHHISMAILLYFFRCMNTNFFKNYQLYTNHLHIIRLQMISSCGSKPLMTVRILPVFPKCEEKRISVG